MMPHVIPTAVVLCLLDLLVLVNSFDSSSHYLESQRQKRELTSGFNADKSKNELVQSQNLQNLEPGVNFDEMEAHTKEKRFSTYEDLNKRLRQFIGKRTPDVDLEKRMRYFLGKRADYPEFEKRMRYFLGKRGEYEEMEKRMRYLLGKRLSSDSEELIKRNRYFLGKRANDEGFLYEPIVLTEDDDLDKRNRYFLGKRMRYLIGKRDGDDVEKRMRYFLGKRSASSQA